MKKIYFLLLGMGLVFFAHGQQWPQYSLYSWNPFGFNPAYAGLDGSLSFTGAFRKQWVGLEGSPLSQQANVHMPVNFLHSGFGLYLSNDQVGAEHTLGVGVAYSYQLELGGDAVLSAGVNGQWLQYTLEGDRLRTPQGSYEGGAIDHNDAVLPESRFNASTSTLGAGLYFQHPRISLGLSVQNALSPSLSQNDVIFTLDRAFLAYAGTRVDIGRHWQWQPSILAKTNSRQWQVDWTTIFGYDGNFFGGFSFRGYDRLSIDAAVVLAGVRLNEKFFLGYAYDFSISSLRRVNDGSHEIVLRYNLRKAIGKERIPPIIYSPRF
ncbi:MAG: type IX secretion system membrane protein PorP/SprF [Saprospirales bacterium]|nr:type IX secretion system membrane protein PorP/SprF [Saprospirales bacterium]MBK8491713.1 type IX secretion system membrane protein PorP/SprF [Saprospirales bacterium]